MARGAPQGIRSLEVGLGLFRHLHRLQQPATLTELSKLSSMPPSKVHRYCVSLIRSGLVQQDKRGLYALGPFCFQLSEPKGEFKRARDLASAAAAELVRETGETTFISAWGQTGPFVLHVEEPPRAFSVRPTSRGDMPLLNSATGRAFAAYLDPAKLTPLIDAELSALRREAKLTAAQIAERRRLFDRHLDDVRKFGLARTTGERFAGINSFSAPVFGRNKDVVLAISSHGLEASFPAAWDSALARAIREAATALTSLLGGRRPDRR